MKKFLVTLVMLVTAVSFMSAVDLGATKESNLNKVVLEKYKNTTDIALFGVVTAKYKTANVESITIDASGTITIIGKADAKGNKTDIYQLTFYAEQVMIKTTAKSVTLVVKTASNALGGFKLF